MYKNSLAKQNQLITKSLEIIELKKEVAVDEVLESVLKSSCDVNFFKSNQSIIIFNPTGRTSENF